MKSKLIIVSVVVLMLLLISVDVRPARSVDIVTGIVNNMCWINVRPYWDGVVGPIYWVYYPDKDVMIGKCIWHTSVHPEQKITVIDRFSWSVHIPPFGDRCMRERVNTLYPNGKATSVFEFKECYNPYPPPP